MKWKEKEDLSPQERYLTICLYIMMERRKDPADREFSAFLDLLPKSYEEFPIFFNETELSYLEGSYFKEKIKHE